VSDRGEVAPKGIHEQEEMEAKDVENNETICPAERATTAVIFDGRRPNYRIDRLGTVT
jgi:hypothetical protein